MKKADQKIDFSAFEVKALQKWETENIFAKQNARREAAPEFAFYDGPPFANGLPHYGHLLANTIKDVVPRYWIMRGYKVNRRFGWDCHGLPVEFEIEKREGIKGRLDILNLGIQKFNEMCQSSVFHYAEKWRSTIKRLGRWVDWDCEYRTLDKGFMESVWWVFSELYKKGLIYQDFKVVPYSPRTGSVVSNFEANQNYKMVADPSITIKLKEKHGTGYYLVWTTTPWTLPSNLAIAMGPKIPYVRVRVTNSKANMTEEWILAEERLSAYVAKEPELSYEILSKHLGSDFLGREYEPPFHYYIKDNAFKVLNGDFVETSTGTGIVHQAPAYGEDDFLTCRAAGIELRDPVNDAGVFMETIPEVAGLYFKDADKKIIQMLKEKGILVKHETFSHSYPFDERTDTPLMYKAMPSWYVAVEKFRDKLIANNLKINWVPEHLKLGRMGTWLENARDWSISRNRFWGTPLPVWICEKDAAHKEVFSSVKELEGKCGKKIEDLHLHVISDIEIACPHCASAMRLTGEVFDCWFESGSMPYAQLEYPQKNREVFEKTFPADFIAEGLDQTRGWFYTLAVLSTALFDKPAFKNVVVNGVILDETGKKMSKRHRNYTPPEELIDKYGADSVRLYMLHSPLLKADDLIFKNEGVEEIIRSVMLPLWNAYSFLSTYALADNWTPDARLRDGEKPSVTHEMDLWIISSLETLLVNIEENMQAYKLYLVVPHVLRFVEDLTNWYIRLNRRRFWGDGNSLSQDTADAYKTLYYTLLQFSKIIAPFAPFIADTLYDHLTDGNAEKSVHLVDYPKANAANKDAQLETKMGLCFDVISLGRTLRQKHKIKTRQVLGELVVMTYEETDAELLRLAEDLLKAELNIKTISFTSDEARYVDLALKPNLKRLGSRLGKDLRGFSKSLEELSASPAKAAGVLKGLRENGHLELFGHRIEADDLLIDRHPRDGRLIASQNGVTLLLDTTLTPELIHEGQAREIVNRIQNLRKDSGLNVSDRIHLDIVAHADLLPALKTHEGYIKNETLAVDFKVFASGADCSLRYMQNFALDDMPCVISLEPV